MDQAPGALAPHSHTHALAPNSHAPALAPGSHTDADALDSYDHAYPPMLPAQAPAPRANAPEVSPLDVIATLTGPLPDAKKTTVLSNEIKAFIVRALARYHTPYEITEAVFDTFGIRVSRQRVYSYDPTGAQPPSKRWCDLHAATRQAFLNEVSSIGVAHKATRLKLLDLLTERAIANNRTRNAAVFLEQAAKECGGIYERKSRRRRDLPPNVPSPDRGEG